MLDREIGEIIDSNIYLEGILKLNDFLANNPELSGSEYNSSKKMVEFLENQSLDVEYPFAGIDTAFRAIVKGKDNKGPKIAILAEYDALPEIGHACGHCASGSISLLTGLILKDLKPYFKGEIHIIGTPDEEVYGSKITMVEKGVFDDFDYAIMMHMSNRNDASSKFVALNPLVIEFFGKTSHAASAPWEGRNAFNAMQLFFHATDMMRQHIKPDARLHGIVKDGGKAPNVVPDYAMAEFLVRANEMKYVEELTEWVIDCAKAAALATKTEAKISPLGPPYKDLAPNAVADKKLRDIFSSYGLEIIGEKEGVGSSDIGEISYVCPAFHPTIKVKEGIALHTKEFADEMIKDTAHKAIESGAKILSTFIMDTLLDDNLLEKIKEEHKKYRG